MKTDTNKLFYGFPTLKLQDQGYVASLSQYHTINARFIRNIWWPEKTSTSYYFSTGQSNTVILFQENTVNSTIFQLTWLQGKSASHQGRSTLIPSWDSWCEPEPTRLQPHTMEVPTMSRLQYIQLQQTGPSGSHFLSVRKKWNIDIIGFLKWVFCRCCVQLFWWDLRLLFFFVFFKI